MTNPFDPAAVREMLSGIPGYPWRWVHDYDGPRGKHWCLENDQSAVPPASTICFHLVTLTQDSYEYDDDNNATPLDETPMFRFIAAAPELLEQACAEVERLRVREQTISAAYNRQNDTIRRMESERQAMQQRILELEGTQQ